MLDFFADYGGSIIIGLILLLIVGLIVWKMLKDKKAGKHSCGGNCAACGGCSGAHGGCAACAGAKSVNTAKKSAK